MIAVFLQARLGSTRLPRKALLPLGGDTVIGHAMNNLRKIHADEFWLLTDKDSYTELQPVAAAHSFECLAGSKNDVLRRFVVAAEKLAPDLIFRATGDNPLVSAELANMLLEDPRVHESAYSGYLGPPVGVGIELINTHALLQAHIRAKSHYDREHVTPYLYNHPDLFEVHLPQAPEQYSLPEARVTLDTVSDYRHLEHIYAQLSSDQGMTTLQLINYLRNGPGA
ncbi:MAG: acylneuraminate cytidylyltransferase [Spirochaetaceae bacterium]|nr:MAG: acylneuraminate cytidylyltransferase [Spirochaetaceae bacterium]